MRFRSDEEVEEEEERADTEKDCGAIDLTVGNAAEFAKKARGKQDQPRFLAKAGGFYRDEMSDKLAADRTELVMQPGGNVAAMDPQKDSAADKNHVTDDSQKTES